MVILTVGPFGPYRHLCDAVSAATAHDEVHVEPGLYTDDAVVIDVPLSIVGIGGRPVFEVTCLLPKRAGIVTTRSDICLSNLAFRGAHSLCGNGAGIWHERGALRVENCVFRENQNGMIVAGNTESIVVVSGCSFFANGAGCGHTHGLYVADEIKTLVVEDSSFHETIVGHHVKSRARRTHVVRSYFGAGPQATTSYALDLPIGGVVLIESNTLIKGRSSDSFKMISYGAEGMKYAENKLVVCHNIFINHKRPLCVGVANYARQTPATLDSNAFERVLLPLVGAGRKSGHWPIDLAINQGSID